MAAPSRVLWFWVITCGSPAAGFHYARRGKCISLLTLKTLKTNSSSPEKAVSSAGSCACAYSETMYPIAVSGRGSDIGL
jgi:hypothetical protein